MQVSCIHRLGLSQGSCDGGAQGGAGVRAAGSGLTAAHDAAAGADHRPLLQTKLALPLAGASSSVASRVVPEGDSGTWAAQVCVPTAQPSVAAGQTSGWVVQLAWAAALHAPLLQLKVATPVVGCVVSLMVDDVPDGAVPSTAEQLLPATLQPTAWPAQGCGGAVQLAPVAAPHAPWVQAKVAEPVVGCAVSSSVKALPDVSEPAAAEQRLLPTFHDSVWAAQGGGGATQLALVAAPQAPRVQVKVAEPVVGCVVSSSVREPPDASELAAAEQLLLLTLHDSIWASQGGGGSAQDALVALLHWPLAQANVADPVAGPVVSEAALDAPDAVAVTGASQRVPFTTQLRDWALQAGGAGTAHCAAVGIPQAPSLQLKVAWPSAGASVSLATAALPDGVLASEPLQLSLPTFQLTGRAAQLDGAGIVQDACVAAPKEPLVQVNRALPVAGALPSVASAEAPDAVSDTAALQALPPTLQLSVCAAQAAGGTVHDASVAAPNAPFEQANLALPVAGALPSVASAETPEAVSDTAALQELPPTFQDSVCAVQAAGGAVQDASAAALH